MAALSLASVAHDAGLGAQARTSIAAGPGDHSRSELEVAIATGDRCGEFSDTAPGLVAHYQSSPGDVTEPVRVCLRSKLPRTHVSLSVRNLADAEIACTGDESDVDATCGSGEGELSGSVTQAVVIERRCFEATSAHHVSLRSLVTSPLPLFRLHQRPACVVLAAHHDPPSAVAAHAGQSDVVRWVYAFEAITE